jgi:hypothetical protein
MAAVAPAAAPAAASETEPIQGHFIAGKLSMKSNHGLWRGAVMLTWYALRLLRRPAGLRTPAGAVTANS